MSEPLPAPSITEVGRARARVSTVPLKVTGSGPICFRPQLPEYALRRAGRCDDC